jgi:hypothetical protein
MEIYIQAYKTYFRLVEYLYNILLFKIMYPTIQHLNRHKIKTFAIFK